MWHSDLSLLTFLCLDLFPGLFVLSRFPDERGRFSGGLREGWETETSGDLDGADGVLVWVPPSVGGVDGMLGWVQPPPLGGADGVAGWGQPSVASADGLPAWMQPSAGGLQTSAVDVPDWIPSCVQPSAARLMGVSVWLQPPAAMARGSSGRVLPSVPGARGLSWRQPSVVEAVMVPVLSATDAVALSRRSAGQCSTRSESLRVLLTLIQLLRRSRLWRESRFIPISRWRAKDRH